MTSAMVGEQSKIERVELFGYHIIHGGRGAVLNEIVSRVEANRGSASSSLLVTLNPEMVVKAEKDAVFREILRQADLTVADGVGIAWASKRLKNISLKRFPGVELLWDLLLRCAESDLGVFLIGGKEETIRKTEKNLRERLPKLRLLGAENGYFHLPDKTGRNREKEILNRVIESKPDLLVAGLGSPRQEIWLSREEFFKIPLRIGVGGSFEVLAGEKRRAPRFFQVMGLEWLFRILQDVRRVRRLSFIPRFTALVIRETRRLKRAGGEPEGSGGAR